MNKNILLSLFYFFIILLLLFIISCKMTLINNPFPKRIGKSYHAPLHTDIDTNIIFLQSVIGNQKKTMMIDNAAISILFIQPYEIKNYHIFDTTKITDAFGNSSIAYLAKINQVFIGKLLLKNKVFLLSTLTPKYLEENKIDGIIGHNILNKLDYSIDFVNSTMLFKKIGRMSNINNDAKKDILNISFERNQLEESIIYISINNTMYPLIVDLGSSGFIDVAKEEFLPALTLPEYIKVHLLETVNKTFIDTSRIYIVDSVIISNKCLLTSTPVSISKGHDNMIGMKFFRQFDIVSIRNSDNTIQLKPFPVQFNLRYREVNCKETPHANTDSCIVFSYIKKANNSNLKIDIGNHLNKSINSKWIQFPLTKGVLLSTKKPIGTKQPQ